VTATEPCLATGVFAEPFPINCCLCWLHNYGFQQTRQNILGHHIMLNRLSNIHFSLFKLLVGYPFFLNQTARHSETSIIKRDLKKTQTNMERLPVSPWFFFFILAYASISIFFCHTEYIKMWNYVWIVTCLCNINILHDWIFFSVPGKQFKYRCETFLHTSTVLRCHLGVVFFGQNKIQNWNSSFDLCILLITLSKDELYSSITIEVHFEILNVSLISSWQSRG
jgi:hypothetical protein